MKILIIGGTGLISTAITRDMVARGDDVTLYNRGISQAAIPGAPRRIVGDRRDYAAFEAQMAQAGPFDCVIDMVCYLPEEAESVVRAFGGRSGQFIFCSTVDVYTKPAKRYPITEAEERRPALSFPYAFSKAACERILEAAHQRGDLTVTIIRPAQTYSDSSCPISLFGPGLTFLRRVRQGKPLIVLGDGMSLWVACHRDDVARAFVAATGNPQTFGQSYHVAGEEWMTWDHHYQTVARVMGAPPPRLVHIPTDLLGRVAPRLAEWCVENFRFNNIFDNTAARRDLGFRYTIPWEKGVRRMVAWHDERGEIDFSPDYPAYDRIIAAWEHLTAGMAQSLADLDG